MLVLRDWNEQECRRIAVASGVKQTLADVSYANRLQSLRRINKKWGQDVYCLRTEHAFLCATCSSVAMRIICIAVEEKHQKQGIGRLLLSLAIRDARQKKQNKITTLTAAGVEFYAKCGFDVVGCNEKGEYKMQLFI